MPTTARNLGLIVNNKVDERLDLEKSTRAAAQYLRHQLDNFKDFQWAIAAYNYGGTNLRKLTKWTTKTPFSIVKSSSYKSWALAKTVTESGGLLMLRRKAESSGGGMKLSYTPQLTMTVTLQKPPFTGGQRRDARHCGERRTPHGRHDGGAQKIKPINNNLNPVLTIAFYKQTGFGYHTGGVLSAPQNEKLHK